MTTSILLQEARDGALVRAGGARQKQRAREPWSRIAYQANKIKDFNSQTNLKRCRRKTDEKTDETTPVTGWQKNIQDVKKNIRSS